MEQLTFIKKLLELQSQFQLAVFKDDLPEIERLSIIIGKLIIKYLGERKLYVDK